MRRFRRLVAVYLLACVLLAGGIVVRGDGPQPRVLATYPPAGSRYWPGGMARLVFSRPMDTVSVENGLQVTPSVPLQYAWTRTSLSFQPVYDWRPDATYTVRLAGAVADAQGRTLGAPLAFTFRVHYLGRLGFCLVDGVRNVCEYQGSVARPLTHARRPVLEYAPSPYVSRLVQTDGGAVAQAQVWDLSPPGSLLTYTTTDNSGQPHVFLSYLDGRGTRQLTFGGTHADTAPYWAMGDVSGVWYFRQPVRHLGGRVVRGDQQVARVPAP